MKVQDLFEAKPNSVQIKNQSGTYKRFKSMDSPGVDAWRRSYDEPAKPKREKMTPEQRAANIAQAKKDKEKRLRDISDRADDALAYALDGGDPIDKLSRWMDRTGITMDEIDAVVNKEHKLKGGLYAYIAQAWADMQGDRIHDVEQDIAAGKKMGKYSGFEYDRQFYDIEDGKVVPRENPWGSTR